jgi:hypothetical protein
MGMVREEGWGAGIILDYSIDCALAFGIFACIYYGSHIEVMLTLSALDK